MMSSKTTSPFSSLVLAAAVFGFCAIPAISATTIMNSSTLNGSFEDDAFWVNSFAETGTTGTHQYETNWSSDGSRSIRIRSAGSGGTGSAQNTGFIVSSGLTFDLSFDWNARAGWKTTDAIAYTLFTTDDNTSGGNITMIAQGSVDGFATDTGFTIEESFSGIGSVAGASVGQELWIEFAYDTSSYTTSSDMNARVDNVVLTAVPEPSSFSLLGIGLAYFCFRRRHS